ncbi:MAG: hypothetical protein IH898_03035 [Planctomycetes bacterium]|nr:hypothetical protein [Planctomycetota bacterium]
MPSLGLPSLGLPSLGLPSLGLPSLGFESSGESPCSASEDFRDPSVSLIWSDSLPVAWAVRC